MTGQTEAHASGTAGTPAAPMTRREALARERATSAKPATVAHAQPSVAEHRHAHAATGKIAPSTTVRTRMWQPRKTQEVAKAAVEGPIPARSTTHWVRGLAGAAIVAGLFATVILPAYALTEDGQAFAASDMFTSSQRLAQSVDVAGAAGGQAAGTDGYSSESAAQVAAARIQAVRTAVGYVPAFQSAGDDYPFWNQSTEANGGGLSPLGYFYRECVDFVAWRLNRDVGSTSAPWRYTWHNLASGSAYMWYSAWQSRGWPTSSTPVPGAVAWFPYNHVAYVRSVNSDGSVNIEEYNQQSDHLYHTRTIAASDAVYLYPPG